MTGLKSSFTQIHKVNAEPELKLCAAMIAAAAEDARLGDCSAYEWLKRCSLRWLYAIVPTEDDCERILDQLLETVPEPANCHGAAIFQPSEMGMFVQPLLPGLEVHHDHGDCLQEVRPRAPTHYLRDPERQLETSAVPGV